MSHQYATLARNYPLAILGVADLAQQSPIEWTQATWNPVTGCDRVSPGCDNCYALSLSGRLKSMGQQKYQVDGDPRTSGPGFGVQEHWGELPTPLIWRKPRTIFVNSMSDLAHPRVSDRFIAEVYAAMAVATQHRYQILTKRPRRLHALLNSSHFRDLVADAVIGQTGDEQRAAKLRAEGSNAWPLPGVWLGVSAEDSHRTRERVSVLADTPASVRFISAEPLLEDITEALTQPHHGVPVLTRMDWIIVGGESGPKHRSLHVDWVRGVRDMALAMRIPFFFKQWGGRTPKAGGRNLDGRTWDQMPNEDRREHSATFTGPA